MWMFIGIVGALGLMVALVITVAFAVKKNPNLKKAGIAMIVCFALFVAGVVNDSDVPKEITSDTVQTASKQPSSTLKEQQTAFNSWNTKWESELNIFDGAWEIWKTTFDGMSKGTIDQYVAYSNLSGLEQQLGKIQGEFYGMDVPNQLSKEHQDLLKEAATAMGTAAYCRREGVKKMMKFMDDPKPSLMEEAKEEIAQGDAQMISAMADVVQVQQALNPEEKKN